MCINYLLPLLIIFSDLYTFAQHVVICIIWHCSLSSSSHTPADSLTANVSPTLLSCLCLCGCTPLLFVHNCNDHIEYRRQGFTDPLPFSGCYTPLPTLLSCSWGLGRNDYIWSTHSWELSSCSFSKFWPVVETIVFLKEFHSWTKCLHHFDASAFPCNLSCHLCCISFSSSFFATLY